MQENKEIIKQKEVNKIYTTFASMKSIRKKEREKKQEIRKRKKEIENLESTIEKKENLIKNLDNILCDPSLYEEPEKRSSP